MTRAAVQLLQHATFCLCLSLFTFASAANISIDPGVLISVATNSSTGSVHLLAWNPLTAETLASPAIQPWWSEWDSNSSVTIDPSSAFGDFFLHEDGIVYYILFLSNTASPVSQRMTQYVLYDPLQPGGWIAPTPGSSCMITQASSAIQPAMANMHLQAELGTMIGLTDFSLQDEAVRSNSSFLGLVSVMWNEPTCFLYPILSFAQGLPAPLKTATAAGLQQHSDPLTFSYVGEISSSSSSSEVKSADDDPSVSLIMIDVSSPVNASLLTPPGSVTFSLSTLNVTAAQFNPAMVAALSPAANEPTFGLIQSVPSAKKQHRADDKAAACYVSFDDDHSSPSQQSCLPFFPSGAITGALATDAAGNPFLAVVGLISNAAAAAGSSSTGAAAAFFAAPSAKFHLLGPELEAEWTLTSGATLSFVPRSFANSAKNKANKVKVKTATANPVAPSAPSPPASAAVAAAASSPSLDAPPVAALQSSSFIASTGDPDYVRPDSGPPLSAGQIALIVILVVAFFATLCACWVLFERRRARQQGASSLDRGLALSPTQQKAHASRMSKQQQRAQLIDEDGVAMGLAYEPPTRGRSSLSFSQDV